MMIKINVPRCFAVLCVLASSLLVTTSGVQLADSSYLITDRNESWINVVRFIDRDQWTAMPPSTTLNNLTEIPAPNVIISHTATEPCTTQSECVLRVRRIQTFHMESRGWSDIAYNFLVGGDGFVYVGRGWDAEGAHTYGWNKKSIGISFIGTFYDVEPPKRQLDAALGAIEIGVKLGKITTTYKLLGHRQVSQTLSPGEKLYEIIKKWNHWSPKP